MHLVGKQKSVSQDDAVLQICIFPGYFLMAACDPQPVAMW